MYLLDSLVAQLGLHETHLHAGEGLVGQGLDPLGGLVDLVLDLVREVVEDLVDLLVDIVPSKVDLADGLVDKAISVAGQGLEGRAGLGGGAEEQGRGGQREHTCHREGFREHEGREEMKWEQIEWSVKMEEEMRGMRMERDVQRKRKKRAGRKERRNCKRKGTV